jgi:phage shock protein PspC (stress-responsive transcriptional regulator)
MSETKRFTRDTKNALLGGVCSGTARYFNIDVTLVRIVWILVIGLNLFTYLILWLIIPSDTHA